MKKKPEPKPEFIVHTIEYPGETLGYISKWYTGAFDNWQAIKTYNGIKRETAISIGQQIKIPYQMVVRIEKPARVFFVGASKPVVKTQVQKEEAEVKVKTEVDTSMSAEQEKAEPVKSESPEIANTEATEIDAAAVKTEEPKLEENKDSDTEQVGDMEERDRLLDELLGAE